MAITARKSKTKKNRVAMINLPLSDLRYLQSSNKKKIVLEISLEHLRRVNSAKTFDELINEARLDYALGNYTTHKSAKSLIAGLES